MPSPIEISQLVNFSRFPHNVVKFFCIFLYSPFGLLLFVLRTILGLSVVLIGCTLQDTQLIHKLVNKIACVTLGVTVNIENPEKKENVEVFISNSVSIFDHLVVHTATGSVAAGSHMHPSLAHGLGLHYFGPISNLQSLKKNIGQFLLERKIPVYFTPEDKITNGKAILKFKTHPFSLTNKVQPICLSVERPFFDLAVTTLGSSYWSDWLIFMFSPLTNYKLKFLPPLERKTLTEEDYAEITRQNIANGLKVEISEFSAGDVVEWQKRQLIEQRVASATSSAPTDRETRRMATQVKEVLPHVPLSVIIADLNITRNVDTTISKILEGRLEFVSEAQPSSSEPSTSTSRPSPGPADLFNTAATSFAKSAHERNRSFKDRKEQLISNARRRYIEKHNLNIPV